MNSLIQHIKARYEQEFENLLKRYELNKVQVADYWGEPITSLYRSLSDEKRIEFFDVIRSLNPKFLFKVESDNDFKLALLESVLQDDGLFDLLVDREFQSWTDSLPCAARIHILLEYIEAFVQKTFQTERHQFLFEYLLSTEKCSESEEIILNKVLSWFSFFEEDTYSLSFLIYICGKHCSNSEPLISLIFSKTELLNKNEIKAGLTYCILSSDLADTYAEWLINEIALYNKKYAATLHSNESIHTGHLIYLQQTVLGFREEKNIISLINHFVTSKDLDHGDFNPLVPSYGRTLEQTVDWIIPLLESDELQDTLFKYFVSSMERRGGYDPANTSVGEAVKRARKVEDFYQRMTGVQIGDWTLANMLASIFDANLVNILIKEVEENTFQHGLDAIFQLFKLAKSSHPQEANRMIDTFVSQYKVPDPRNEEEEFKKKSELKIREEIDRFFDKNKTLEYIDEVFKGTEHGDRISRSELFDVKHYKDPYHFFTLIPPMQLIGVVDLGDSSGLIYKSRFDQAVESNDWMFFVVHILEICYVKEFDKNINILTPEQKSEIQNWLIQAVNGGKGNRLITYSNSSAQLLWEYWLREPYFIPENTLLNLLNFRIRHESDKTATEDSKTFIETLEYLVPKETIKTRVIDNLKSIDTQDQEPVLRHIEWVVHFNLKESVAFLKELILNSKDQVVVGTSIDALSFINIEELLTLLTEEISEELRWSLLMQLRSLKHDGVEKEFLTWFTKADQGSWFKKRLAYLLVEFGNIEALEYITLDIEQVMEYDTLGRYHEAVFLEKKMYSEFLPYLIRLLIVSSKPEFGNVNSFHSFKDMVLSALLTLGMKKGELYKVVKECEKLIESDNDHYGFLIPWLKRLIENNRDQYILTIDWNTAFDRADQILKLN